MDAVLAPADGVLFRDLAGEAVILAGGHYYGLNEVGTRAWHLIVERGTLRAVYAALLEEFDAPPDVLQRDLLELVEELSRRRLLVVRS